MRLSKRVFWGVQIVATIVMTIGLRAISPAPINGYTIGLKPHTNLQPETEKALEEQQNDQKVIGDVGSVPLDTNPTHATQFGVDPNAVQALNAAGKISSNQQAEAKQNIAKAESERAPQSTSGTVFWAVLCLAIGAGSVFGVKKWADSAIPAPTMAANPPTANSTRSVDKKSADW